MNRKLFYLLALTSLLTLTQPVRAVTVGNLYTIELPVADQTTSLRLEAFTEAFKRVVVKASGSDDALQSPAFARPIERSSRYVKQFSYIVRENQDKQAIEDELLYLRVDFDQRLIESLLRDNGFPVWGRERPGSLLVISYDVNETIKMVSSDTTPEIVDMLDNAAQTRGLPVLFPLMDLEDMSLVRVGDVISRHFEKINIMASRYTPDVLVVGQVVGRSGKDWEGDWEVRFLDQLFKWRYKDSSKETVIEQMIKHLTRILALEYALEDNRSLDQELLLSVSSMSGIGSLIKVQQYLQSLNVVDTVRVSLIDGDLVTYRIGLRNEVEDLQRLIEIGEVLEQEDFPQLSAQGEDVITLNYNYLDRGGVN